MKPILRQIKEALGLCGMSWCKRMKREITDEVNKDIDIVVFKNFLTPMLAIQVKDVVVYYVEQDNKDGLTDILTKLDDIRDIEMRRRLENIGYYEEYNLSKGLK